MPPPAANEEIEIIPTIGLTLHDSTPFIGKNKNI
jgi:hypothetical protein